jgi:hypothetical protein
MKYHLKLIKISPHHEFRQHYQLKKIKRYADTYLYQKPPYTYVIKKYSSINSFPFYFVYKAEEIKE